MRSPSPPCTARKDKHGSHSLSCSCLERFITAIGFSKSLWLTCLLIFFCGILLMIVFAVNSSLVQSHTSDAMRGRVMSVYNLAFRGGMPMGSLHLWSSDEPNLGSDHNGCKRNCHRRGGRLFSLCRPQTFETVKHSRRHPYNEGKYVDGGDG